MVLWLKPSNERTAIDTQSKKLQDKSHIKWLLPMTQFSQCLFPQVKPSIKTPFGKVLSFWIPWKGPTHLVKQQELKNVEIEAIQKVETILFMMQHYYQKGDGKPHGWLIWTNIES